jgi:hypothetical protein
MTKEERNFALNEMRIKYGSDLVSIQEMLNRRGSTLEAHSDEALNLYFEELLADEYAKWKVLDRSNSSYVGVEDFITFLKTKGN